MTESELKEIETFFLERFRKELAEARQEHYFREVESRQIRVAEEAQLMALNLIKEIRDHRLRAAITKSFENLCNSVEGLTNALSEFINSALSAILSPEVMQKLKEAEKEKEVSK